MKTADLTGAWLDYWTARARGVDADRLAVRPLRPALIDVCFYRVADREMRVAYTSDWAQGGPLIAAHQVYLQGAGIHWLAEAKGDTIARGPDPLTAVCRAVVRATFGDEVPA